MAKATTAQVNADLIRSAYDAFSHGDMEGAFAVFAKDILWHIPGREPLSRDYRGHAERTLWLKVSDGEPLPRRSWCHRFKSDLLKVHFLR